MSLHTRNLKYGKVGFAFDKMMMMMMLIVVVEKWHAGPSSAFPYSPLEIAFLYTPDWRGRYSWGEWNDLGV